MNEYDKARVESVVDRIVAAKGAVVRAEIDAGACGTPRDYRVARELRQEYERIYEHGITTLVMMLESAGRAR